MWEKLLTSILLVCTAPCVLLAETTTTALAALRVLPPEEASHLARVAGAEGTPNPERWHFILHDPQAVEGFRDVVVSEGKVVARNGVSQFASNVRADEVLGKRVRVDSDRAARVAQRFAAVNGVDVVSLNYELRKDALGMKPVWKVTCLNHLQEPVGWVVVNALDETVVAQGGFTRIPSLAPSWAGEPMGELPPIASEDDATEEGGFHPPAPTPTPKATTRATSNSSRSKKAQSSSRKASNRPVEVRRAERVVTRPVRIFRGIFDF